MMANFTIFHTMIFLSYKVTVLNIRKMCLMATLILVHSVENNISHQQIIQLLIDILETTILCRSALYISIFHFISDSKQATTNSLLLLIFTHVCLNLACVQISPSLPPYVEKQRGNICGQSRIMVFQNKFSATVILRVG